ncbi:hypothetical protein LSH36_409g02055 [Paralvinella palmiformis]|uniref:SOSS complex subunit C n=1 Tax=Paralvinella palmiformis TaxID=53620 RepID=A0AAD9JBX1_9ANNE|nr:hypothetical protein LSH36_409g02055 [Paralvinella palmiformis]
MAFQTPNTGQERQNRKILEQLEEQKKRLRMQTQTASGISSATTTVGTTTNASSASTTVTVSAAPVGFGSQESQHMTQAQRAALQFANANSVGYFISQDSSFGNLILPVIPRLEKAS